MAGRILGGAAAAGAAGAVVGAYLLGGPLLVLVAAAAGALWAMFHVAHTWSARSRSGAAAGATVPAPRRAAAAGAGGSAGSGGRTEHCERCRRAREALESRRAGRGPGSAGRRVGHDRHPYVLDDEGGQGEGVEDLVETEPAG